LIKPTCEETILLLMIYIKNKNDWIRNKLGIYMNIYCYYIHYRDILGTYLLVPIIYLRDFQITIKHVLRYNYLFMRKNGNSNEDDHELIRFIKKKIWSKLRRYNLVKIMLELFYRIIYSESINWSVGMKVIVFYVGMCAAMI